MSSVRFPRRASRFKAAVPSCGAVACMLAATPALAAPAEGSAEVSASASTDGDNEVEAGRRMSPRGERPDRDKWIHRWAPVNNMGELGVYGGVWFPSRHLELYEPDPMLAGGGWQRLNIVAPEIGLRGGYYPWRFFGVEAEGGVMPTSTRTTDAGATAWTVRGHIVGQLGLWSITPFLLVGTGVVGIAGDPVPQSLGSDQDVAIHFGGGAKFYINKWIQLRLDIRDVVSNRRGVGEGLTSSPEILLGLSITLGRNKKEKQRRPTALDRDGDRILDKDDYCPDVFGVPPRGCPTVCIDDNDGDGIPNPEDSCPEIPETRNGFEDSDGCPDEVPPELADLAGVMENIHFDTDKATIKPDSTPQLDNAVRIMKKYPNLRIEVVGHTDSRGGYRHNMDLSERRAASVKQYLVDAGVDAERIDTRGAGPDEPIETNDTPAGRAKNRRIEFILQEEDGPDKAKAGGDQPK